MEAVPGKTKAEHRHQGCIFDVNFVPQDDRGYAVMAHHPTKGPAAAPRCPVFSLVCRRMTARIREELWQKATAARKGGSCIQIWSFNNEQGFRFRALGEPSRELVDFEGLHLVARTIASD